MHVIKKRKKGSCCIFQFAAILFFLVLIPEAGYSANGAFDSYPLLSLEQAFARVVTHSPSLVGDRLELELAEARMDEVTGRFRSPQFEAISYGGLVSDARGNVVYSPDTSDDYSDLGPFFKIDMKIIQPLYTFGKYEAALEAGEQNIAGKEASYRDALNEVRFLVTKAYLGVMAGNEGSAVGKDLLKHYHKLTSNLDDLIDDPDSDLDSSYRLEAQTMFFEITRLQTQPQIDRENAIRYLKGLLGYDEDINLDVIDLKIPVLDLKEKTEDEFVAFFLAHSPLIHEIDKGISALRSLQRLEENKKYPDLFVAMGLGYGTAPGRDEQDNAFVNDDYNYEKLGAVFGMKWDFNFHGNRAKETKIMLEHQKAVQKKKDALTYHGGKIRKLLKEAQRYQVLYNAAMRSLKSAKSWLRLEQENFELGIGDIKRFVKAYQTFFDLRAKDITHRYHYLLTLAELARYAGDTTLFVEWIDTGKVHID